MSNHDKIDVYYNQRIAATIVSTGVFFGSIDRLQPGAQVADFVFGA